MRPLALALAGILLAAPSVRAQPTLRHTFTYVPPIGVTSVALVGSFNAWDASAHPMALEGGRWSLTLELPPGEHTYKFVVDGREWLTPPDAPVTADDGFGGRNAVLRLETPRASGPAVPRGELDPSQVRHRAAMPDRNRLAEGRVSLRMATRPGDLRAAVLLVQERGTWREVPMERFAATPVGDYYRVTFEPRDGVLRYVFRLKDRLGVRYYGPRGLSEDRAVGFAWDWRSTSAFTTPAWAKGRVFYQIFPERFANGDPRNDPPGVLPWGGTPTYWNFFGGDLRGIRDRVGYLSELGVEGLYLNPIFAAGSNHKYDTFDYRKIDPAFGTEEDFRALSGALRARGIRTLLDGVFNHTGTGFFAFREAVAKGPESPYFTWFHFSGYPVVQDPKPNYKAWWGFAHLPQLNNANPEVRAHLLDVAQRWLRPGLADGWRLDVPNEVPRPFWKDFRRAVRSANPEGLIVGEIWGDGSPWLAGDGFDSVMNYRFRQAVLDYVAYGKADARAFGDALDQIRADYGDQVEDVLFNLLDSHDTPRFLHEAKGDKRKLRLAALLQMTLPGMPVVYYGTEVGMTGGKDPDNRRTMVWEAGQQDRTLFADYKRLIGLRRAHPSLRQGDYARVETGQEKVFAFRRTLGRERLLIVVNTGNRPFAWTTLARQGKRLDGGRGQQLGPLEGVVLKLR